MPCPVSVRGIAVLGMHRGGTSLAAELVSRWGAFGDERSISPGDDDNPRGYWEYGPLVRFNEKLLKAVDSQWNVPPAGGAKPYLAALAKEGPFRRQALDLLAVMQASGRPWFWKDPRLTVLLPFWKELWGDMVYVVPVRDPGAIVASLGNRDGFPVSGSLLLWQRYMSEVLNDPDVMAASIFLSYEQLLADGIGQCRSLCRWLDERLGIRPPEEDQRPGHMAAAIDGGLRRSRNRCPFAQDPMAGRTQKALHQALESCIGGALPPAPETYALEPQWRESLLLTSILSSTGVFGSRCQVFWKDAQSEYEEARSRSRFLSVEDFWQPVEFALPPATPVSLRVDLSDRPGLLRLLEMAVKDSAGNDVWVWDGIPESIGSLARNQIGYRPGWDSGSGCLLVLEGNDPWLEIPLSTAQSAALEHGGTLVVRAAALSSFEYLVLEQGSRLKRFDAYADPLADHLEKMDGRLTQLVDRVEKIAESRTWRTLTAAGGAILRVRNLVARLLPGRE